MGWPKSLALIMTEAGCDMQATAPMKNGLSSGHSPSDFKVRRPRKYKARILYDAIQYIAAAGCQWTQLLKDFPPSTTVQYPFYRMRDQGLLDAVNAVLVACMRVAAGQRPNQAQASSTSSR